MKFNLLTCFEGTLSVIESLYHDPLLTDLSLFQISFGHEHDVYPQAVTSTEHWKVCNTASNQQSTVLQHRMHLTSMMYMQELNIQF